MAVLTLRVFLLVLVPISLCGQSGIRLKGDEKKEDAVAFGANARSGPRARQSTHELKSLNSDSRHVLLTPSPEFLVLGLDTAMAARNISVVQQFAGGDVLVVLHQGDDISDLALAGMRQLSPDNKLSEAMKDDSLGPGYFVVEFHPDVLRGDAESILLQVGLTLHDNSDLNPNHFLVDGPRETARSLADWDEVAYVFEASADLISGAPAVPCAGFVTGSGLIGQYIATIGDGWDGPGLGAASLTYSFSSLTPKLSRPVILGIFQNVLGEWAKVAALTFTNADKTDALRNLNVLFASGAHGDGYPFDGPGKVLAHTFFPAPPNPEPIAGDLHFDADENWNNGTDVDLFSVMLHEMGHALGLGHSDKTTAVMYPYYQKVTKLSAEDIGAVLTLYAAASATPAAPAPLVLAVQDVPAVTTSTSVNLSGTTSGGTGAVTVNWSDQNGHQGVAQGSRTWTAAGVPLAIGNNSITITAQDANSIPVSKIVTMVRNQTSTAPVIAFKQAIVGTSNTSSVSVSGTAFHASGISKVTWSNQRGRSGAATGTTDWSANVPLLDGQNVLQFTATAGSGQQVTISATVNYVHSLAPDLTPPTLTITSPSTATVRVSNATIRISGTASDNVGVTGVTWTSAFGSSGTATGTTQWSTADIPLLVGDNRITIRATDAAGNVGWRSLVVTRQ